MNLSRRIPEYTGFHLICIVLVVLYAWPALGAERELNEDPAPGSASEIKTPIQRIFPFVFDPPSKLEIRFRTAYIKKDRTNDVISEAWAMGGSIYYLSDWLNDLFAVEVEGFTSQPIHAPDDRGGTFLLASDQDGYSALGIANAKLRHEGFELTAGRQYLDLPYVNRADSRMTPNTFESVTLAKSDGRLQVTTGYTWKIKKRTSEDFVSMTKAIGLDKDRGLGHLGVVWDPDKDFHIGVTSGVVPDLFAGVYGELGIGRNLANDWETRLDAQFTRQWEIGDDLYGVLLDNAWNLGLRASASRAGAVFRLGMSITSPNASVLSLYGTRPSYVDLMQHSFNLADEKAILTSVTYDFSGQGLEGLSMIMNFVAGFDGELGGEIADRKELDLTMDYRVKKGFLKNFWLRVRGSWLDKEFADNDGTDFRVILRYDIPII